MKGFPVPVVALGPGSQTTESPDYLPLPSDMTVFRPPLAPEAPAATLAEARGLLEGLLEQMRAWSFGSEPAPGLDLGTVPTATLELVNQCLGEGEVSVLVRTPHTLRIQETAFAGIWHLRRLREDGSTAEDRLEVGAMPAAVLRSLAASAVPAAPLPPAPAGVMNSPAIAHELLQRSAAYRPGEPAHVVNLSLLPVVPTDLEYLAAVLGQGPVTVLSRGYGNCRITSTALPGVWWVQYFNSMDKLILNTIEVVDLPEVALAAREDCEDSTERLAEWIATLEA